jgi:hypothetical protein
MKRTFILALMALAAFAPAQTLQAYMHMRRSYHISGPISPDVLLHFNGAKICEVAGTVKGTFAVGSDPSVLVELKDGNTVVVQAATLPDWIKSNEVDVRLIVRATGEDNGQRSLELLGAAPEDSIPADPPPVARKPSVAVTQFSGSSKPFTRTNRPKRNWVVPASEATPMYAAFIKKENRRLSDGQCMEMAEAIVGFGIHYGVDPRLIMSVLLVESGFDPQSTSRSGAMGVGQLMPGTADWMGVRNPYDTVDNIHGCVKLIRTHLDQYMKETGNREWSEILAIAAYNAGIGAVRRSGGVPHYRETQAYVRHVITFYNQMCGN